VGQSTRSLRSGSSVSVVVPDGLSLARTGLTRHVLMPRRRSRRRRTCGSVAEVVELGAAGISSAENLELGDHRGVEVELTLHADFLDDAATVIISFSPRPLRTMRTPWKTWTAPCPLPQCDVDVDGVADIHAGDVLLERGGVEGVEDGELGVGFWTWGTSGKS